MVKARIRAGVSLYGEIETETTPRHEETRQGIAEIRVKLEPRESSDRSIVDCALDLVKSYFEERSSCKIKATPPVLDADCAGFRFSIEYITLYDELLAGIHHEVVAEDEESIEEALGIDLNAAVNRVVYVYVKLVGQPAELDKLFGACEDAVAILVRNAGLVVHAVKILLPYNQQAVEVLNEALRGRPFADYAVRGQYIIINAYSDSILGNKHLAEALAKTYKAGRLWGWLRKLTQKSPSLK